MDDQKTESRRGGDDEEFSIDVWEWIRFIIEHVKFIGAVTALFAVAGVVIALSLPAQYTASATILPPQSSDSKLSGLLSSFGGLVGDVAGVGNMSQIYPDIAKSRIVIVGLLDAKYEGNTFESILTKRTKIKARDAQRNTREYLIRVLRGEIIRVSMSQKTDVVTVSATYSDPKIASALVNEVLNQMEKYFRVNYRSAATGQRIMLETRLNEVAGELRATENQLLAFEESNRVTGLAPHLLVSQGRLQREVQIKTTLYTELTKQYELSKVSELQTKPVLNILDRATPPIQKSKPVRRKVAILAVILGFVASVTYLKISPVIYREVFAKLRNTK